MEGRPEGTPRPEEEAPPRSSLLRRRGGITTANAKMRKFGTDATDVFSLCTWISLPGVVRGWRSPGRRRSHRRRYVRIPPPQASVGHRPLPMVMVVVVREGGGAGGGGAEEVSAAAAAAAVEAVKVAVERRGGAGAAKAPRLLLLLLLLLRHHVGKIVGEMDGFYRQKK